jgi:iron complex outermembrane receptor protein
VAAADGTAPTDVTQNTSGSHLLARHEWLWSDGSEAALQGYADSSDLEVVGVVREKRTTIDLDFQNRPHFGGRHDVVWGLGYRESHFNIGSGTIVSIAPDHGVWRLASAFVQDEITLAPDALRLVLGTRFEHNSLTGFEPQPNLRLIWTPTSQQSVWGALSRAVRTPSVAERGAQIDLNVIPPGQAPFPTLVRNVADTGHPLGDEVVKALELGFRQQFDNQLSLDLALFHNRYDQLRAGTQGAFGVEVLPVLHGVQAISTNNAVNARTRGVELALDWRPTPRWRLQPAYSYIRIDARAANADPIASGAAAEYNSSAPRHQFSLRASTTLTDRSQFDAWLRRIGTLPAANPGDTTIAAYTTLDLRYAWRLGQGLDLSVVGQNLLEKRHAEIVPELLPSQSLQMQRAVLLKMKWQF